MNHTLQSFFIVRVSLNFNCKVHLPYHRCTVSRQISSLFIVVIFNLGDLSSLPLSGKGKQVLLTLYFLIMEEKIIKLLKYLLTLQSLQWRESPLI